MTLVLVAKMAAATVFSLLGMWAANRCVWWHCATLKTIGTDLDSEDVFEKGNIRLITPAKGLPLVAIIVAMNFCCFGGRIGMIGLVVGLLALVAFLTASTLEALSEFERVTNAALKPNS